jgi:hypothetical protein
MINLVAEDDMRRESKMGIAQQPRITIAVHNGFSIRYLLHTDILPRLRALGAKVTLLMQGNPDVLDEFAGEGYPVVSIPAELGDRLCARGRLQRALTFIRHYSFGGWVQTLEDHYNIALKSARLDQASPRRRANMWFLRNAIVLCRRFRLLRKSLLALESQLYAPPVYQKVIKSTDPDLLVTSSLGTFDYDYYLMRGARRAGVPTAAVILSWDNTTTRGYPGAASDYVITWTELMKREAVEFSDVPEDSIVVGGVAHFDGYFREDPDYDRAEFLRSLGVDPAKRVVLFITKSPNGYAYNPNIGRILGDAVAAGMLPDDVQVLVRVHPIHYRYKDGKLVYEGAIQAFRELAADNPAIVVNEPTIRSTSVNSDMASSDLLVLARLLRSADVVVNIFSTINLEGAIFDKPLVNVCFECSETLYECRQTPRFDIDIDIRATHNERLAALGGVRMVHTPAELVAAINAYLADPSQDRQGRRRVVEEELGPNRGRSGEFIAETLYAWAAKSGGSINDV